jgi:hypothetical protein
MEHPDNPMSARAASNDATKRLAVERDAYLERQLRVGEKVLAREGVIVVTDDRILFAWRSRLKGHLPEWHHDAIRFDEVRRWSLGRRHDERPLLRLDHRRHVRREGVVAHNILWFHWGHALADVPHTHTTLPFKRTRSPVLRAVVDALVQRGVPQGDSFVVAMAGTREERLGEGARRSLLSLPGPPPRFVQGLGLTPGKLRRRL